MVGDDDDLVAVPDLGVLAEVLLEDADGARAADVVRHEDVRVDPDVVAGLDVDAAGVAGEDFLGQGHRGHKVELQNSDRAGSEVSGSISPSVYGKGRVCSVKFIDLGPCVPYAGQIAVQTCQPSLPATTDCE